ncbi:MAG: hypothetical protein QNJ41_05815 [Xenococcaceae cyanobacterium MO_188.B32]|nr:hypothetical protein [Xenococcaceae cyanobacterium MO_188.B32]
MSKSRSFAIQPKPLGMVLREADLVSIPQLQLALQSQTDYPHLRLGEILALRGWLKPETADFLAQDWLQLVQQKTRKPLGYYLQKSALLDEKHIKAILEEQKATGIRFGTVAVLQGLLKSTTLDFFLMYLFPKEVGVSSFVGKYQINARQYQQSPQRIGVLKNFKQNTERHFRLNQPQLEELAETEII